MNTILIVDDHAPMREQYAYDLARAGGFHTLTAAGGNEGLSILEREAVDCVVLDLEMPGMDGFGFLEECGRRQIDLPIIVYTGTGTFDRCIRAVRLGAYSFVDKAEPIERVVREIENALAASRLRREVVSLRQRALSDGGLIGASPVMQHLREQIARLAPIPSPVLISGESGTGKELVARALHETGPRKKSPFVALNCAALPESLVESELFGHERGAFTGADRQRKGAFESAEDGSLFLDEVAELPLAAQAKLLRVLESERLTRLGASKEITVHARIVAATHRDLEARIRDERFRDDLYYRLNVHVLRVPPLRDRKGDIPALVDALARRVYERFRLRPQAFDPAVVQVLSELDWARNNVRELRNAVERLILAAGEHAVTMEHVPTDLLSIAASLNDRGGAAASAKDAWAGDRSPANTSSKIERPQLRSNDEPDSLDASPDAPDGRTLRARRDAAEKAILVEALERNGGHLTRTASELGLADHSSLLKILKRHGLR